MHVFGPTAVYPGAPDRTYTPMDKPLAGYDASVASLGFQRLVFVQPSAYGTDNRCLLDAMKIRPNTRAVAVIDPAIGDDELRSMDAAGVRGIRLNLMTPRLPDLSALGATLRRAADRVGSLGWHIQIYADTEIVTALAPAIRTLGIPLVLDHMGGVRTKDGSKQAGFDVVLDLLSSGACWVKVSGADIASGMTGKDSDLWDAQPFARALIAANPANVLWGSDWPHLVHQHGGIGDAAPPAGYRPVGDRALVQLFWEAAGDDATRRRILVDNPARLYRF
jgi:predicted TIM-barrel fold metal-dependent hydrolase